MHKPIVNKIKMKIIPQIFVLQEDNMQRGAMQFISKKYCMRGNKDGSNIYVGNKGEKKRERKNTLASSCNDDIKSENSAGYSPYVLCFDT